MSKYDDDNLPHCFGKLSVVFPEQEDGFRKSPESCFLCFCKTKCLKKAMDSVEGLSVQEKVLEKAEDSKLVGFFERWKKKKYLTKRKIDKNDRI